MKSYIQDWIGSRLGILIDISPENFGRHIKDGKLLAELLYSYGAIPLQILQSIKSSKNVNDCYNNLKILKPWLEYVEVPVKDEMLYDVACGQGTAGINLISTLYLSMQYKDRLHYVCRQKERAYSEQYNKRKIKVTRVFEKDLLPPQANYESEFALPLIQNQPIIEHHKQKCSEILRQIKTVKKKTVNLASEEKTELGPVVSKFASSTKLNKKQLEIANTEKDLQTFSEKYPAVLPDLNYQELIELQNQMNETSLKSLPNPKDARKYMNTIKQKAKAGILLQNFQEKIQMSVIHELFINIKSKQDDEFEEIICKNLLKQSQYEKQMCTKLAQMRQEKGVQLRNRQFSEMMTVNNLNQKEYDNCLNYQMEMAAEDIFEEEFEKQRLLEFHKRMYIEKVKLKFRERLQEAKSILYKLIDIAIRISEFRENFACEIPRYLMKDMKELFFKDLPIFDILEDVAELYSHSVCDVSLKKEDSNELTEEFGDPGEEDNDFGEDDTEMLWKADEECGENDEDDAAKVAEFVRQEVLNECDFNDYMFLLGPWMVETLMPEEIEVEADQTVLGYIVHKMLTCKYPLPTFPVPAEIKPMNPRAIVQGSSDESAFIMLSELLSLRKILVVRVDDAINFVLAAYKEEMPAVRDIDITFQIATKTALKGKGGTERLREPSKKEFLIKKESVTQKKVSVVEPHIKEVSTQTPRNIPEDDPLLSTNAEIGKLVFDSLGIGDPVPDITVISAVIAYVASLQDEYDGWVLWNYPVLYSQASKLESALTGYDLIRIDNDINTVEEIEGFSCRSNCQNPYSSDEFANLRISRLVPKSEWNPLPEKAESYFSSFVKLRKKNVDTIMNNLAPPIPDDLFIEQFYTEQEIFYCLDYTSLNFQTVKDIGKVILGEVNKDSELEYAPVAKTSVEIFGASILELNEKYNPSKKKIGRDSKKPLEVPKKRKNESESINHFEDVEVLGEPEEEKNDDIRNPVEERSHDLKPGDPDWVWATGFQPEEVQIVLAGFWENLEAVYIEDFKYLFFCLRIHRAHTLTYKSFLKKALHNYLRRGDMKQSILDDFQQKFNDIDDDLRVDSDFKCELHVRVSEFEETLLELADDRRDKSEKYRVHFINDHWTEDQMSNLVNLYVRALQLEADRCIDTCQFINDYYLSLQRKLIQENVLQKIYASTLFVKMRNYSVRSSDIRSLPSAKVLSASQSRIFKQSKISLGKRGKQEKVNMADPSCAACCNIQPEIVSLPEGSDAINNILINLSYPQDGTTPYHIFYNNTAEDLRNQVRSVVEGCLSEVRRSFNVGNGGKDKKKTSEFKIEGYDNLYQEWTLALETELNRFLFRTRLIQCRGILDFNDFILTILNTIISLSEDIGDIYNKEVHSISECCKVFRCAIEEEVAIQPRLELNVDEFVINQSIPLFPNPSSGLLSELRDPSLTLQFTTEQLSFIIKKMQYIAPNGEIIRRAFLYILEDLRIMKSEDGTPRLLPQLWDDLDPNDLPFIFDLIYKRIEIVNWKDFIIYALELPMPSDIDILNMRSIFRSYDHSGAELINFNDFMSIGFWFENFNTRFENYDVKELLFEMYQVNEEYTNYTALLLAFCKDEDPNIGFLKAIALSSGKRILKDLSESILPEEGEQEGIIEEEEDISSSYDKESFKEYEEKNYTCEQCMRYKCECKDPSLYQSISEMAENPGEAFGLYFESGDSLSSVYISDIPRDIIKKVLLASYPSFPQLSVLLNCNITFEQTLDDMLQTLSTDGMSVKISKLLKHKFIFRILISTNKFKSVDLQNIVKSIIERKHGNNVTSCSQTWS